MKKLIVDLEELMEVIAALESVDHDIPAIHGADLLRGIIMSSPEYFPPTDF